MTRIAALQVKLWNLGRSDILSCQLFFKKICDTEFFKKHLVYFELVFMIYFILVSIGLIVFHLFFIVFLAILIFKKTQTILLLIIWFFGFNDTIKKIPSILIFFLCFFFKIVWFATKCQLMDHLKKTKRDDVFSVHHLTKHYLL